MTFGNEMKCLQMALLSVTTTTSSSPKLPLLFLSYCATHTSSFSLSVPSSHRRPFQPLRLHRCRAAIPDPPPPPPRNDSTHLQDLAASLSKIQDRAQIFFAVLFWMSLFFWASAWDGRNRPNKGSRFRK